jgi:hypothetical protein
VKVIAPDKKEFQRFRDLVFEAILPSDGSDLWLGLMGLLRPKASSLQESIMEWFICPKDKLIGQVTPYKVSLYLQTCVGLTWDWIQEWICPYIEQA